MNEKHQGWVANLSDGRTIFEDAPIPGEPTPWTKLRILCDEEGVWVTQIQLQINGKTWRAIKNADGYCWFRDARIEGIVGGNINSKHHAGIGAVMGDVVYCTVIDANGESFQETRPLSSMRAHCVMKP